MASFKEYKLVHLCIATSFFTSGLIINLLQLLLHVCVKPINKTLYRKIVYYLNYSINAQLVFMADWWSNNKLYVYADDDLVEKYAGKEHGLIILNHSYEIDWIMGWSYCDKIGVLGNVKAYAKKVVQYFPVYGWSFKFSEYVFLERSYEKDKEIINKQLDEIFDYPDPVWLVLNAEGTRFNEEKHAASVKFANERGMTVLKHHLIPRTKGFVASLPTLRKQCPAVYDIQLAFKKDDFVKPTALNILFGRSVTGHVILNRIDINSIPERDEDAAEWLHELYRQKDRMQESFHQHGDFFTGSGVKRKNCYLQKRRLSTLLNTAGWAIVTLVPMVYYLAALLFSGRIINFFIGIGIISIFHIFLQKSLGMSKINKGSSYEPDKLKKK